MGIRGRKPISPALKIAAGNPGKQTLNTDEPKPRPISAFDLVQRHSQDMSEAALEFWLDIGPVLEECGVITEMDWPMAILMCESYATYVKCTRVLNEIGATMTTEKGYEVPRPEVAMARRALKDCESLMVNFGMSPAARTRVKVSPEGKGEEGLGDLLDK